ncbi:MAG: hypothetical protein ACJ759_11465, partial [Thermoanaerobaculia bacterium]
RVRLSRDELSLEISVDVPKQVQPDSTRPPSRLNCWIANTLSLARFPCIRWRLAGILKTLGPSITCQGNVEAFQGMTFRTRFPSLHGYYVKTTALHPRRRLPRRNHLPHRSGPVGREPLGREAILSQHPQTRPERLKKSPAPLFHAASKDARQGLKAAYGLFLAAFREAAERLKAGDRLARFPNGCFPPALPFVGLAAAVSP